MKVQIVRCGFNEIKPFVSLCMRYGLVFCKKTNYLLAKNSHGEVLGFCGFLEYKNKRVLKNDFVFHQFRGNGIFKKMVDARIRGFKGTIEATCTAMSIREYEKRGFKVVKEFKNGCKKVRLENL